MRVLRGVVYMTKSSGPRTWGTPQEDVYQKEPWWDVELVTRLPARSVAVL